MWVLTNKNREIVNIIQYDGSSPMVLPDNVLLFDVPITTETFKVVEYVSQADGPPLERQKKDAAGKPLVDTVEIHPQIGDKVAKTLKEFSPPAPPPPAPLPEPEAQTED